MNQTMTGRLIAQKRKEKNWTQEQLAGRLGISNKTISKWENGKCMPDYSLVQPLCQELGITVAELMNGEEDETNRMCGFNEQQTISLLERIQNLEKQKQSLSGSVLIAMGTACLALSQLLGGTPARDFIAGFMLGLSIVEMLAGVYIVGCVLSTRRK